MKKPRKSLGIMALAMSLVFAGSACLNRAKADSMLEKDLREAYERGVGGSISIFLIGFHRGIALHDSLFNSGATGKYLFFSHNSSSDSDKESEHDTVVFDVTVEEEVRAYALD